MKQPVYIRVVLGIGGICSLISGMSILLHSFTGFIPTKVPHPYWLAGIGFLASISGMVLSIEKFYGKEM